jgi:hypothetical protein
MAVLSITSAASATPVTTDAFAAGANPTDPLLNDPLVDSSDSHQIAWHLIEEQLRFQYHGSLHQSHSSRKHGGGTTIGPGGQGDCGANNVPTSTSANGHNGHQGKNRFRPLPQSTTSCPPPHPANGGNGVGSNDPPGGNGDPTGSSGSDSSGVWLSDPIVPNDPSPAPEPGSHALLALGLGSLWLGKRRS